MPETTDKYVRLPVKSEEGKHQGHSLRTITISKDKGIKALYCKDCKKIVTYLFLRSKGWTLKKARAWLRNHTKKAVVKKEIYLGIYVKVFRVENKILKYRDEIEYNDWRDWHHPVVCKSPKDLVDVSYSTNKMIKFLNDFIRSATEIGMSMIIKKYTQILDIQKVTNEKENQEILKEFNIIRKINAAQLLEYMMGIENEMTKMTRKNEQRMWGTLAIPYGQGVERALGDVGVPATTVPWAKYRETAAFRIRAIDQLKYLSDSVTNEMKYAVAVGVAEGLGPREIAKRIRDIRNYPKSVIVPDKIVNGEVVRKGYTYQIPAKRYSEMVARTESHRALSQGRLDGYRRVGIEKVRWLSAADDRVCAECEGYDGQIFKIDEVPGFGTVHVSCRCTQISEGLEEVNQKDLVNTEAEDFFNKVYTQSPMSINSLSDLEKKYAKTLLTWRNLSSEVQRKVLADTLKNVRNHGFKKVLYDKTVESQVMTLLGVNEQIGWLNKKLPKYKYLLNKSVNNLSPDVPLSIGIDNLSKYWINEVGEKRIRDGLVGGFNGTSPDKTARVLFINDLRTVTKGLKKLGKIPPEDLWGMTSGVFLHESHHIIYHSLPKQGTTKWNRLVAKDFIPNTMYEKAIKERYGVKSKTYYSESFAETPLPYLFDARFMYMHPERKKFFDQLYGV